MSTSKDGASNPAKVGEPDTSEGRKRKRMRSGQTQKYRKAEDDFDETVDEWYHVRGGFRYVRPYKFNFRVNCKQRWTGDTILDVFAREFNYKSLEYWRTEIETGRLLCCDRKVGIDFVLRGSEWLTHMIHRHESVVLDEDIAKVFEDENLLVVEKPASIPVHPCGAYRRNTLVYLIALNFKLHKLHTVHRLDKQTSGLVIFAKNKDSANSLSKQIESRSVKKVYLALVEGQFPVGTTTCHKNLSFDSREQKGMCNENGKEAETTFELAAYDSVRDLSLVRCFPKTGRTHQIRIHLQSLGHPICNDPVYAQFVRTDEETKFPEQLNVQDLPEGGLIEEAGRELECSSCPSATAKGEAQEPMSIYLHAEQYSGDGWKFRCKWPIWAERFNLATK